MNFKELHERGWTTFDGITSQADLLDLGRTIGTPVRAPNGEFVKEIRKLAPEKAPPGSQSSLYGAGRFPLHTDTVFWPTPVRYLLLRGHGDDLRRPTTVMSFESMIMGHDLHDNVLRRSVWKVRAGGHNFYCSLCFKSHGLSGWRYDPDIMFPVNQAAHTVHPILRDAVFRSDTNEINWTGNRAAILDNWSVLHGRAPQPDSEGFRVVDRLYVR